MTPPDMQMDLGGEELKGSLRTFKFPGILQFLSMNRMTGYLKLSQEGRRAELGFRDGRIVSVTAGERYMRLGQMLVSAGKVSPQAVETAIEERDEDERDSFLGEVLLARGQVSIDDLRAAVRAQLEEELWEFFSWETGNFHFEQGMPREARNAPVELDVAPLIKEGGRRLEEWQVLCSRINDPNEVMKINPEYKGPPEQPLDDKTWRVLALVDGRLSVDAVVRFSTLGKFETYWALDRLLRSELIVRGNDPDRPAPGAPEAPAVAAAPRRDETPTEDRGDGGKSLLGFLGRKKGPEPTPRPAGADSASSLSRPAEGPFDTDLALLCDLVNRLLAQARSALGGGEEQKNEWLASVWREVAQRHPRCDALVFRHGRLDSGPFDRYADLEGEIGRPLAGIHADCLYGLRLFWDRVAERLEGAGDGWLAACASAYSGRAARISHPEFSLARWRDDEFYPHPAEAQAF